MLKIYHWNAIRMFSTICVDIPCLRYLQEQRSNDVHSLHRYFSYPCLTTIFELPLYQFFIVGEKGEPGILCFPSKKGYFKRQKWFTLETNGVPFII